MQPLLATSWTKSADAKTWTFTIRQGVKFHDGTPMTAAAVKAAIDRTIKLNQGAAYIWGAVKSIDAPDATTVVFHLKYPAPIDLISSAGYAAFIYDTKARRARRRRASGSRRATTPAPAPTPSPSGPRARRSSFA